MNHLSIENCSRRINEVLIVVIAYMLLVYSCTLYLYLVPQQLIDRSAHKVLFILITIFFVMSVWSYAQVMFANPGISPVDYVYPIGYNLRQRYCLICQQFKPERTHHCSRCRKCILFMHIHLEHFGNCIGFYNRKHFLLYLMYFSVCSCLMTIFNIYFLVCELQFSVIELSFIIGIILLSIIQLLVSLLMIGFLVYHSKLIFKNYSTMQYNEHLHTHENNMYDVGAYNNFKQVFGSNCLFWFFPITIKKYLTVNGTTFPKQFARMQ